MTSSPYRAGRNAQSLYENVELLTGQRGDGLDKALTLRDLSQLGMVQLNRRARGHYAAIPHQREKPKQEVVERPSVPRSLSVSGGFGAILLHWAPALYAGHAHTEIWRASSNSLGLAQRIATTPATTLGDIVRPGSVYYYWIRHVNIRGIVGPFHHVTGKRGQTSSDVQPIIDELTEQMRSSPLIAQLSQADESHSHALNQLDRQGSQAYRSLWAHKVSAGDITARIGLVAGTNGLSQVAIAATQVFVFDPNRRSPALQPAFAIDNGQVVIPKALIETATVQVLNAQTIVADEVKAGIAMTAPTLTGAVINGAELNVGSGGPYQGYHTRITHDGRVYTDHLIASGGEVDRLTVGRDCVFKGRLEAASGTFHGTVNASKVVGSKVLVAQGSTDIPSRTGDMDRYGFQWDYAQPVDTGFVASAWGDSRRTYVVECHITGGVEAHNWVAISYPATIWWSVKADRPYIVTRWTTPATLFFQLSFGTARCRARAQTRATWKVYELL